MDALGLLRWHVRMEHGAVDYAMAFLATEAELALLTRKKIKDGILACSVRVWLAIWGSCVESTDSWTALLAGHGRTGLARPRSAMRCGPRRMAVRGESSECRPSR